jgi:Polyketide cyclase / dehydrase and lipid transport
MRAFRYVQHIERPQDEVFAFIMNFGTASRWRSLVRRMEVVGGGPVRQGSKLLMTMDVLGKTLQLESEVWCYEPPHRVGQRNQRSGVTGVFEYILEPDRSGTTVIYTCDIRPHGLRWLTMPWLLRSEKYRFRDQLNALKRAIEQNEDRKEDQKEEQRDQKD